MEYGLGIKNNHLYFGGADTVELAKQYGTPLYVFDEQLIREYCRDFKNSIDRYYDGNGMVLYASKAFSCKEMYRIANDEGIGVDTVSGGEIYTALSAGFPAEKIFFHGNNKTNTELKYAIENNIGHIVIDDFGEIDRISEIAGEMGKTVTVMLRIKPGIDAHTHDFIKTGQNDCKFGFTLETGEAFEAAEKAINAKNINLSGFHCHIGSQIFSTDPFCLAAEVMANFIANVTKKTGHVVSELNLGGGFGIRYTDEDEPLPYSEFMNKVSGELKNSCNKFGIMVPKVFIEPGRSIVGPAGITLYTVGSIKTIPGIRTYVSVDGGMTDNPRYALYGAKYDAVIANKAEEPGGFVATVAGKCCESGDLIGENIKIATPETGDILAVLATGAYNYSMASNYNRIPRPAAIMVKNGEARVIIKRETFEDLISKDV
ncbi:MAG: diaminopimelate decarboxylase [Ruminococcaceae bacterium]|nr:diaminopimelate decarboxylase [Oscillospiraceae bacterium]